MPAKMMTVDRARHALTLLTIPLLLPIVIPTEVVAQPEGTRHLLVFSLCEGFAHSAINPTEVALREMGERTGAFEVTVSTDMEVFEAASLARFDAVLFNNTTNLAFEESRHRRALLEFVRSGKGVIGIHAATDNFFDWPEAAAMMGGLFDGHPWAANGTWAVKLDEQGHPLNRSFGGEAFLITDEIYQVKGPYSRDTHRVLLSLDMSNPRNHQVEGINREDGDFAISWIKPFGEGRVFYCSLGHNHEVLENEAVLEHYLAGIRYALGDLEVDDSPSNSLSPTPVPVLTTDAGAVEDPFMTVVHQEAGFSRLSQFAIEEGIRNTSPAHHYTIEARLIEILDNPESTYEAKQFVCRMLRRIGPERTLPHLARMLLDPDLTDDARFAMQGHRSSEIDRVLRESLDQLEGQALIGVIGTIGQRRDGAAVTPIVTLINRGDTRLTRACVTSLGRIGGAEAQEALFALELPSDLEPVRQDALLRCADNLVSEGAHSQALDMYQRMTTDSFPVPIRIAAWRGLVRSQGAEAVPSFLTMLRSNEPEIQRAGARFMIEMRESVDLMPVADQIDSFPQSAQVLAISGLASAGVSRATQVIVGLTERGSDEVREAALSALGELGDASHVPLLVEKHSRSDEAGALQARNSLIRMRGEDVDERIISLIKDQPAMQRGSLIEILAARNSTRAIPAYFTYAEDRDEVVRMKSIEALARLATPDRLPDLIGLITRSGQSRNRNVLETAIVAVCERMTDREQALTLLLEAFDRGSESDRISFLRVFGQLTDPRALTALNRGARDSSQQVRIVAIRALGGWSDTMPMGALWGIARAASTTVERMTAIEGILQLLDLPNDRSSIEEEQQFKMLLDLAGTSGEKELILDGLSGRSSLWIFGMVEPLLDDPALTEKAGAIRADLIEAVARTVTHAAVGCPVTLANPCAAQYDGGGQNALTDDQWGSTAAGDGKWQGFEGEDLDAVIDLGRVIDVTSIRAGFLEANISWIFLPREVTFSIAGEDRVFETVATTSIPVPGEEQPDATRSFSTELTGKTARYVRVVAKNIGALPTWHSGAGGRAWLFADEIQVNARLDR
ncbi:ThuA domain-containing protein [Candidatus Zixiibacteriota bacterium]